MKKQILYLILMIVLLLTLSGCLWPESANSLYKYAKKTYGDCTLISKIENKDGSKIIVHDTLQDFDYTVSSFMNDISIDGSSFGSVASKGDDFMINLIKKIESNIENELTALCTAHNCTYEINENLTYLIVDKFNEDETIPLALEVANLINEQNKNHRLDDYLIWVEDGTSYSFSNHFGSIALPNIVWRTPEDETLEEFIQYAKVYTDRNAIYLYKEVKTFADTGLSLEDISSPYQEDKPIENMESPVTYYYFQSPNGEIYYICDVWVNDGTGYPARYTNYIKPQKKPKDKSFLNFIFGN